MIIVYKYLWREEISDNGGVFNLADKKKIVMRFIGWKLKLRKT